MINSESPLATTDSVGWWKPQPAPGGRRSVLIPRTTWRVEGEAREGTTCIVGIIPEASSVKHMKPCLLAVPSSPGSPLGKDLPWKAQRRRAHQSESKLRPVAPLSGRRGVHGAQLLPRLRPTPNSSIVAPLEVGSRSGLFRRGPAPPSPVPLPPSTGVRTFRRALCMVYLAQSGQDQTR